MSKPLPCSSLLSWSRGLQTVPCSRARSLCTRSAPREGHVCRAGTAPADPRLSGVAGFTLSAQGLVSRGGESCFGFQGRPVGGCLNQAISVPVQVCNKLRLDCSFSNFKSHSFKIVFPFVKFKLCGCVTVPGLLLLTHHAL